MVEGCQFQLGLGYGNRKEEMEAQRMSYQKKNNGYRRSKGDLRAYLSIAKDQDRVIKKDGFFQA